MLNESIMSHPKNHYFNWKQQLTLCLSHPVWSSLPPKWYWTTAGYWLYTARCARGISEKLVIIYLSTVYLWHVNLPAKFMMIIWQPHFPIETGFWRGFFGWDGYEEDLTKAPMSKGCDTRRVTFTFMARPIPSRWAFPLSHGCIRMPQSRHYHTVWPSGYWYSGRNFALNLSKLTLIIY